MSVTLQARDYDAAVLDLDGVLTDTARLHREAWKQTFDAWLAGRDPAQPPFSEEDYRRHVDGKPRCDGVQSFLAARGFDLPWGSRDDPPDAETVCGLGARKNARFRDLLAERGVTPFESSVDLVRQMRAAGLAVGVVSSSRNCAAVLDAAGIAALFDARVDGNDLGTGGLAGKPAPDLFEEAARRLGAGPDRTLVVEDSLAGVTAGRCGGFATVIGIARDGDPEALARAGADHVVRDLGEVHLQVSVPEAADPDALAAREPLATALARGSLALFLDYDGTLTPIVERPEDAVLAEGTRAMLERLAELCPVALVSGRDLEDLRHIAGLGDLWMAGSHGFEIRKPDGSRLDYEPAREALPELADAADALQEQLGEVPGVRLERKGYGVAVHYRGVPEARVQEVHDAVERVAEGHPRLRRAANKKVLELQPDLDWDKGRALRRLAEALGLPEEVTLLYAGDDTTDEDAFAALGEGDVGILVSDAPRPSRARWRLPDPGAMERLLQAMAKHLERS